MLKQRNILDLLYEGIYSNEELIKMCKEHLPKNIQQETIKIIEGYAKHLEEEMSKRYYTMDIVDNDDYEKNKTANVYNVSYDLANGEEGETVWHITAFNQMFAYIMFIEEAYESLTLNQIHNMINIKIELIKENVQLTKEDNDLVFMKSH